MAQYSYTDKVYLVATGEEVKIKKVITNHSKRLITYVLENGLRVGSHQITDIEPVKEEPKRKYTKRVKEVEEEPINKEESTENND